MVNKQSAHVYWLSEASINTKYYRLKLNNNVQQHVIRFSS